MQILVLHLTRCGRDLLAPIPLAAEDGAGENAVAEATMVAIKTNPMNLDILRR